MTRVGYLLTHHPRVSATFVSNEIAGLETLGFEIVPVAINTPGEEDSASPGAAAEIARTMYLKAVPKGRIVTTLPHGEASEEAIVSAAMAAEPEKAAA